MSRRASFAEYRRAMDAAYGRWGPTPRYWLPIEDRIEETKYRYVRGWIDLPEMERIIDQALRQEEHTS